MKSCVLLHNFFFSTCVSQRFFFSVPFIPYFGFLTIASIHQHRWHSENFSFDCNDKWQIENSNDFAPAGNIRCPGGSSTSLIDKIVGTSSPSFDCQLNDFQRVSNNDKSTDIFLQSFNTLEQSNRKRQDTDEIMNNITKSMTSSSTITSINIGSSSSPSEGLVMKQGSAMINEAKETTSFYNKFTYTDEDLVPITPAYLTIQLLPFQQMGVGWMLLRERYHTGGIMADHLGLGKTVQMISLCLAAAQRDIVELAEQKRRISEIFKNKKVEGARILTIVRQMQRISALRSCSKITQPGEDLEKLNTLIETKLRNRTHDYSREKAEVDKWLKYCSRYYPSYERKASAFLKTEDMSIFEGYNSQELRTLIVVPASLLLQWKSEIESKIDEKRKISVFVYHGKNRQNITATELATYDFVLTTYDSLSIGVKKFVLDMKLRRDPEELVFFNREEAGPLFKIHWKRCILDEAHVIRTPNTIRWHAVKRVLAKRKWAVTATPLHNSIHDLQNLLGFVDSPQLPIMPGKVGVDTILQDEALQAVIADCLQPVFLRRGPIMTINGRKTVLVKLPPKEEVVISGVLSRSESQVYNEILRDSKEAIRNVKNQKSSIYILQMMMRLRQCCCHPFLSKGKTGHIYVCGLCNVQATVPVLAKCGHAFCNDCLMTRFRLEADASGDFGVATCIDCPACSQPVYLTQLKAKNKIAANEAAQILRSNLSGVRSTKVDMILAEISHVFENFPEDKVIIFSFFVSFLEILTLALEQHSISFVRIDGTMPLAERNTVIQRLKNTKSVKVLLASKTAMGVGLNLTMTNHVMIVDPWWNPAIEEQTIHRCHRIGQTKKVYVKRLLIEGTIEQYCYEISQRKKEFGDSILKAATGGETSASMQAQSKLGELMERLREAPVKGEGNVEKQEETFANKNKY